jgi:hypothetical protein
MGERRNGSEAACLAGPRGEVRVGQKEVQEAVERDFPKGLQLVDERV